MPVVMLRIDDRLIHGQVVAGWCPVVQPHHLILCNDEAAGDEWSRQIYQDASPDYRISVCGLEDTIVLLRSKEAQDEKIFLVVEAPKDVVRLLDLGLNIDKVVIGGMHHQPGKRKIESFIYVDDEDCNDFQELVHRNVTLEGRDVPTCKPYDLAELLSLSKH